jgi:pimeloyl-ACP methyl ester carboxylesterase
MIRAVEFARLDWAGQSLQIEYQWIGSENVAAPLLVFLHHGLGSLAMWKDFPQRLCTALDCRGLVYSRPGCGRSSAPRADEFRGIDYLHRQAHEILPALMQVLNVDTRRDPPWLFGHSDGASIALLYAARYPQKIGAAILLAPHILVEDISIHNIQLARTAYLETDLKDKLARYHDDPDAVFRGWSDIWLHDGFREWSIEDEIETVNCPLLAVQGVDDEYGTLQQVRSIAQRLEHAEVVELSECRHSPHRDQPDRLMDCVGRFVQANRNGRATRRSGNLSR